MGEKTEEPAWVAMRVGFSTSGLWRFFLVQISASAHRSLAEEYGSQLEGLESDWRGRSTNLGYFQAGSRISLRKQLGAQRLE